MCELLQSLTAHRGVVLQDTYDKVTASGKSVRGMVFINPGNPTGQCLTEENLKELCAFAVKNRIVLMADEVYQPNIYQDEKPFVSARCAYRWFRPAASQPSTLDAPWMCRVLRWNELCR